MWISGIRMHTIAAVYWMYAVNWLVRFKGPGFARIGKQSSIRLLAELTRGSFENSINTRLRTARLDTIFPVIIFDISRPANTGFGLNALIARVDTSYLA